MTKFNTIAVIEINYDKWVSSYSVQRSSYKFIKSGPTLLVRISLGKCENKTLGPSSYLLKCSMQTLWVC